MKLFYHKTKAYIIMRKHSFALVTIILLIPMLISCEEESKVSGSINRIDASLREQILTFKVDQYEIVAVLTLPEDLDLPIPAVVVMHGSGGMWDKDISGGTMSSQFREWADTLRNHGMAGLFIDSYLPRGVKENNSATDEPPGNAIIAAEYVRTRDAYAGLELLRKIQDNKGENIILSNKVALLGFSHGGTAAISAMADTYKMHAIKEWYQREYRVPAPAERPTEGGFVCAAVFYPGCGMYQYYGNHHKETGFYINYAPVLIQAAGQDPLYYDGENTEALVTRARINGANEVSGNEMVLIVYQNAHHSFDGADDGFEGEANKQGRKTALGFIMKYINKN